MLNIKSIRKCIFYYMLRKSAFLHVWDALCPSLSMTSELYILFFIKHISETLMAVSLTSLLRLLTYLLFRFFFFGKH